MDVPLKPENPPVEQTRRLRVSERNWQYACPLCHLYQKLIFDQVKILLNSPKVCSMVEQPSF
jgi:hypothetical protein